MKAERITDSVAYHGEGPVWAESWGGLRWVDMLAGDVLSLAPDGSIGRRHVGDIAAALRPRRGGGAVIGVERGFALEDPDGELTELDELWDRSAGIRMNEGGCDPDGRFCCGTMAYDRTPGAGTIYRLHPDRSVDVVLEGVTISNGLEWSPDGTLAYYNDTETGQVAVFDYDRESGPTERRVFAETPGSRPDGLTVDSEGGVWVALNGRGEVWRFSPEGDRDQVVEVGAKKVTACTFGGGDLGQLFITTSRENLPPDEDPAAGSLFRVEPGVRGRAAREFEG